MEEIEIISKRPFFISNESYYFVLRADSETAELGLKIEGGCFIPITEERDEEILQAFLSELPHFMLAILKGDQEYIEVKRGISLTLKRYVEQLGGIEKLTFKDVLELLRAKHC